MRKAVWLALLVAGCSDADKSVPETPAADTAVVEAADTRPKACEIITAADIASVTNIDVGAGVTTNDYMGVSQCRFDRADTIQVVMVSLHHNGNIDNYRNVPGATTVDGIGEVAVWNQQTGQLAFRKGTAVTSISFLEAPADPEWARTLARIAAGKLTP